MEEFIINKAPGKELIPKIIESKSFDYLNDFYKLRVDWYGYPIIQDRMVTYGLFDDLTNQFPNDTESISTFIDYSIQLARNESDKRLINAIFLILGFCLLGNDNCMPTKSQIKALIELKARAQKLSFFPNMSCFWDQILDYFSKDVTFNKQAYTVNDDDYKNLLDLDFPTIEDNNPDSCPINFQVIENEIKGIVGVYEPLKFVRSAIIDNDKYWVWLYKNITGNVWSWYITVKQEQNGKSTLEKHSMHGGVTKTPEELLLEYHYNS